ncbi:glutamate 5-kinase [Agathobaculum sp.]|uniref:glutamate 5-kinase n=1 Tax=Agathobaculum sp. TaxID=2048138 RepID=UPI002A7F8B75|nr:glutamate 5-kinase [Agathobaculum sp.]MDY3618612.1 glutamate 5-kinase [Agathobaculum sp.]
MLNIREVRRIVVKVGTSTLTYENGKLNIGRIEQLVRCICDLQNRGYEMVLVSSGAVTVGAAKLGLAARPHKLSMKQAAAAVGQCELMHIYDKMFLEYGINVAQILLTRENITNDGQRENIHNTFTALLETGVVPIVNENDTVATAELVHIENFGDNDTLSAVVARMCGADLLVIFSDIDGLFDSDPRKNPQAKLIPLVPKIDAKVRRMAGGAGSSHGTGGMATKLTAAELCMDAGIPMLVANGEHVNVLYDVVDGKQVGTLFARGGKLTCGN